MHNSQTDTLLDPQTSTGADTSVSATSNDYSIDTPDSSNIRHIAYTESDQVLLVTFTNGKRYSYSPVPVDVATSFKNSGSHGKFFYANIRTSFTGTVV